LFINLTPFIPLSFSRRGRRKIKEGYALLNSQKRRVKRGEYGVPTKTKFLWGKKPLLYYRALKRDEVPLTNYSPFPY